MSKLIDLFFPNRRIEECISQHNKAATRSRDASDSLVDTISNLVDTMEKQDEEATRRQLPVKRNGEAK